MKKILFVVGSLRKGSFNLDFAKKTEALLAGKAEVSYLDYSKLPLMNQDLETPVLPEVQAIRDEIASSDLIWFFSPVYNFAMPGTIKNLIDWMSRALDLSDTHGPSVLQDKLTTASVVGAAGHDLVVDSFKHLLPFVRTQMVGEFTTFKINPEAWATGELTLDADTITKLESQVADVLASLAK